MLQRVAACCSVLQFESADAGADFPADFTVGSTVYCSVLQRVAACGSVLQCEGTDFGAHFTAGSAVCSSVK